MKNIADLIETPEAYRQRTAPTAADLREQARAAREAAAAAKTQAEELSAAARKAGRRERQAQVAAEKAAHDARMFEEIGQPLAGLNRVQHNIVYGQAWEQGRSGGYAEVEGYYGEFAEMARRIIDAN